MNPTHPTHYAHTAAERVRRGEERRECVEKVHNHHAIGLQTDCMVTVLAPVVEAARLPRVCPMALGYGLPPL